MTSTAVLILGGIWAPMVGYFPSIFEFFQKCWFFFSGPVASVFIFAIFWKRTTYKAAFWTLIMCFPLFVLPYVLTLIEKKYGIQINQFNLAGVVFVIMLIFTFVVSLLTQPSDKEKTEGLVWKPSMMRLPENETASGYPWYMNLWFWCAVWVTVMVIIYIRFW